MPHKSDGWKPPPHCARVGRDVIVFGFGRIAARVSIHAPAWGATGGVKLGGAVDAVSIHAPAWGATRLDHPLQRPQQRFNPRARVGRDMSMPAMRQRAQWGFNPRARVGRDSHGGGVSSA